KLYEQLHEDIEILKNDPTVCKKTGEHFQWVKMPSGDLNLLYVRDNPQTQILYHNGEPREEAEQVLEKSDLKHPNMVFVFGTGLGYILKRFLDHRPKSNFVICVLEKNPQIFLRALCL